MLDLQTQRRLGGGRKDTLMDKFAGKADEGRIISESRTALGPSLTRLDTR